MAAWNYATIWRSRPQLHPDPPPQIQGDRRGQLAGLRPPGRWRRPHAARAGVVQQDKVAQYLYNCPEYLESMFASFKAGLVPVNTNYRYTDDELVYLWDNADAVAVVFHGAFAERIERIRDAARGQHVAVGRRRQRARAPTWATPYEDGRRPTATERVVPPWGRGGDDIFLLYTGGTTGMPKGVMWRQDDLVRASSTRDARYPDRARLDRCATRIHGPAPALPACPLMHGTGAVHLVHLWAAARRHARRPPLRRRGAARHHRAREGPRRS